MCVILTTDTFGIPKAAILLYLVVITSFYIT